MINVYTTSYIDYYLEDCQKSVVIEVEHGKDDEAPFKFMFSKDIWMSEEDVRQLVKALNKALLVRKKATE